MVTVEHSFPRYYKIGSIETWDPTELKTLVTSQEDVTSGRYDTLESPRGTDYVVPAGKTLYIGKLQGGTGQASGANGRIEIGYGDDGVADSVSAPTNALVVYQIRHRTSDGLRPWDEDVWIPIPAGKYPYVRLGGAGNLTVVGIEV